MQNPFVKLKHYRPDVTHPTENHATEVLAACLVLSDNLRRGFINFLLSKQDARLDAEELDSFTISTQVPIAGYGTVDLLIESQEKYTVVVEVKVSAHEDGEQIRKYRRWLQETRTGKRLIFSLVQTPNRAFKIREFGGDGRRTWHELYTFLLREFKKTLNETAEINLLEKLCNYLEVERIVSTWQPKQIVDYGKGVRARTALRTLFEQVEERLLDLDQGYLTKIVMKEDEWPRLEIGMKSWSSIFGTKGYLNKLYMYYETAAVWEGVGERFYFELALWNKWHKSDWKKTESQLRYWIPHLKSKKFDHWTVLKGSRELEGKGADEYTFTEPPALIAACASDPKVSHIEESEMLKMTDRQLIDDLFHRAVRHCEIISGLRHP
jgi:hypothetical protein